METTVPPASLSVWARQFATLIGAGVSLVRSLDVLAGASESPLSEVSRDLQVRVTAGEVLSRAMAAHPEAFNRLSISLCRAGEVGGVLDETFSLWADWLERDLEFRGRFETYLLLRNIGRWPASRDQMEAELRAALPGLEERVREMTFCRLFGLMLASGVPVLQAIDVAATEVYTDGEARSELLCSAAKQLPDGSLVGALRELGFSPFTVQLAAVGEECGTLDRMMDKAADLLRWELETRMTAALSGLIAGPGSAGQA